MSIVQCGKTSCLWKLIRRALLVLEKNRTVPRGMKSLLRSYRPGIHPHSDLPQLLKWAKQRQCTDPRDKVYGLLGLVAPSIVNGVRVDYSVLTSEVYMSVLLSHISVTKQLDLLQHCQLSQCFANGPSWIPNWASEGANIVFGFEFGRYTSGRSSAQAGYSPPNVLEVVGVYCASISSVGVEASGSPKEILQAIYQWKLEGLQTKGYIAGCSLLHAFLETICQGLTSERYKAFDYPSLKDIQNGYLSSASIDARNEETILSTIHAFFGPLTFITTQEGYLGVTGPGVERSK